MTEKEWLNGVNVSDMIDAMLGRKLVHRSVELGAEKVRFSLTQRKLRLVACALYRTLGYGSFRHPDIEALSTAENFADDKISAAEFTAVHNNWDSRLTSEYLLRQPAEDCCIGMADEYFTVQNQSKKLVIKAAGAIRDIIGNPAEVLNFLEEKRRLAMSVYIKAIAEAAYEDRDSEGKLLLSNLLPLADALQDAGCNNEDLLSHLSGGDHYRGCYVVDFLLGKSRFFTRTFI